MQPVYHRSRVEPFPVARWMDLRVAYLAREIELRER